MSQQTELNRSLGFIAAASLVVGTMIGTGVFLKAAIMSQIAGSPFWVLMAWIVAGLLSLAGALTYAEIGILFPKAGGEYVYLRESYGDLTAYLYGWQRFWVSSPGTIAAYAVGAATFVGPIFNLDWIGGQQGLAITFIILFSALNCLNVRFGGRLQSIMTGLKVLMMLFIVGGVMFFAQQASIGNLSSAQAVFPGFSAFGAAMLAALWAYDGWNNMPMVAGEIKNPQKNIPLALVFGVLFIVIIYAVINFCYFYALPFNEVMTANSKISPTSLPVAAKAAEGFMGSTGVLYLGIAMMFSAVGAMNGSILTNARVPYAMAKDGLFFKHLAIVHRSSHSPYVAVIVQAVISIVLAFSGTFDQLTDYVVFASWIFYALVTSSVFKFRRTHAHIERSYKAIGYPVVPIVFLVSAVLLLVNTLWTSPQESMWGLVIIALGVPFFYLRKKPHSK